MTASSNRPPGVPGVRGERSGDVFSVLVRRALVPLVLLGLLAVVAAVPFGRAAVLGAAVGTVLVAVFFATTLLLMRLTAPMAPALTLGVALLAYWTKASLLGLLLLASPALDWFDELWFGGTVVAGAVVWMVLHVRGLASARIPVFEPTATPDGRAS